MLKIIDQGIVSKGAARGAYMPSITQLADGSLIACQHIGAGLGTPDNRIEVLQTKDDGKTWQGQCEIPATAGSEDWAYRGPDIAELPDGRLLLSATRFENTDAALFDPDTEALQRPEMLLYWSADRGRTWSEPQVVPVDLPPERYTWNGCGGVLQISPTRWMYSLETWKPEGFDGPPDQKAAALFSADQGRTWGELTVIADDTSGRLLWWDQLHTRLADGRIYGMLWTHQYGTKEDLPNHRVVSDDEGRTWSQPRATNLLGQVCCPIALPDGRVAAIYNHRHDPQGVHVAVSDDLNHFDREHEVVVFDAGAEATLGKTEHDNFLAEHMLIAFGKPVGKLLDDGTLLTCFWCTVEGITHTRWVRLSV